MRCIYTPASAFSDPGRLLGQMTHDLRTSRELAWRLAVRNISAMYRQTYFGYLWAFLPPLATTAAFLILRSGGVVNATVSFEPYAAFLLISTSIWQLFADAVSTPLRVMTASKAMLIKINFPREAIILASVAEVLFNFLVRLVIIVGTMLWFGIVPLWTLLLVPLGLLALLAAGTMVGLLLTPIGLLYQDISKALPLLLNFWMLLTPVVYDYQPNAEGLRGWLNYLNPIAPLLNTTREWLIIGQASQLGTFWAITTVTFLLLAFGWVLYRVAMPHVIARLGG